MNFASNYVDIDVLAGAVKLPKIKEGRDHFPTSSPTLTIITFFIRWKRYWFSFAFTLSLIRTLSYFSKFSSHLYFFFHCIHHFHHFPIEHILNFIPQNVTIHVFCAVLKMGRHIPVLSLKYLLHKFGGTFLAYVKFVRRRKTALISVCGCELGQHSWSTCTERNGKNTPLYPL